MASEDTEYYSYSYARLSYVNGDVFIQRAGDNGFEEGDVNLPVVKGDKIGTREGRAEIHTTTLAPGLYIVNVGVDAYQEHHKLLVSGQ